MKLLGNYNQFRDEDGTWDRPRLEATLTAMAIAARYLLMHENTTDHASTSLDNVQPPGVVERIQLEDFQPGESFASYYGKKYDKVAQQYDKVAQQLDATVKERNTAVEQLDATVEERNTAVQQRDTAHAMVSRTVAW